MIYADANATTPLLPEVLEEMMPWMSEHFANPSATYREGKLARSAIDRAREQVANLIGAAADEIVFTSGGTESVNAAIHSLDTLCGDGLAVVSAIEHSAVLRTVQPLPRGVRTLAVNSDGILIGEQLEEALADAAWISVMLANNETGVIQPIEEVVEQARARGLPVHSDAVQAVGKIPVDMTSIGVDLLSISAHKFGGPKGVGALAIRRGTQFEPILRGGGQENGRRSGTENTAGIVGMGKAAELASRWLDRANSERLAKQRDSLENEISSRLVGVTVNGAKALRLPNTSHLSFDGCEAAGLLILLEECGIACSAGSSCMSGKQKPSHVQIAMGIPEALAKSSLRFGLMRDIRDEEIAKIADSVVHSVEKLRRVQGHGMGPVAVYSAPQHSH